MLAGSVGFSGIQLRSIQLKRRIVFDVAYLCILTRFVVVSSHLRQQDDEEWTTTDEIDDDVDESNSIVGEQVWAQTASDFWLHGSRHSTRGLSWHYKPKTRKFCLCKPRNRHANPCPS